MRILNFVSQLFLVVLLLLSSCKKEEEVSEDNTSKLPVLSTLEVTDVLQESASSGGMVLSDGGYTVLAKGVCWSTNQTPTINDSKTDEGSGAGAFSSTITNLTPNSTYYVRAYARNSYGVGYGSTMSFTTMAILTDVDGNTYDIVKIGNQVWMAENLKTTKFNDNNSIPLVTDSLSWINISSAAYCWPQNSQGYGNAYGVLYNWYTVSSDKLCPLGWHVPSNAEWTELSDYLGGVNIAGGKLKEEGYTHWNIPNTDATNEVDFSAVASGSRSANSGLFNPTGQSVNWWSSTEKDVNRVWQRSVHYDSGSMTYDSNGELKNNGFSVRCIKD